MVYVPGLIGKQKCSLFETLHNLRDLVMMLMKIGKKAFYHFIFLSSLTCYQGQVLAQSNETFADSLKAGLERSIAGEDRATTLVQLGKYYRQSNTSQAIEYLDEAIALSQQIEAPRIMADAFYQKGVVMKYTKEPNLKFKYFAKAGDIYLALKDTLWYCRSAYEMGKYFVHDRLNLDTATYLLEKAYDYVDKREILDVSLYTMSLADAYSYGDQYYKSIAMYQTAIQSLKQRGDTINWTSALQKLGNVHYYLGEYEVMLELINESSQLIKQIEQDDWTESFLMNNYMNMSIVLLEKEKLEAAKPYLFKADSIAQKTGVVNPYLDNTMAEYHYRIGHSDSALFRFQRAIAVTRANQDMHRLPVLLNGIGALYLDQKKYDLALNTLLESTQLSKSTDQPNTYAQSMETLANTYVALGDYKRAHEHLLTYHRLSDSLLNEDKIREITTLKNQYAFEEEKQELTREQREKEFLLQSQIQRKEFIQYGLFAGMGVAIVLALLFYKFYQSKKNDHVKISEQAEELLKKHRETTELSVYKQGLTHMIAHDMKNPLNVVISMANNFRKKEDLQEIAQSGKLMLQMVHNMLDIQKFEETRMELKQTHHSLKASVLEAKYQVELLLMAKSIEFINEVKEQLAYYGDADLIVRVLVNLYTNAIKYMPIGGKLTIQAKELSGRLKISITDTGQGISPELQEHIFDKFWQSDPKKYGMTTSNGLGLTFCKMAVMAHGGEIGINSKENEGSTFFFDLEVGDPGRIEHTSFVESTHHTSDLTIEDQELVRRIAVRLKQVPIYKSSKIEDLLKELDPFDSPGIGTWKHKIREASYRFDNRAFEELINV